MEKNKELILVAGAGGSYGGHLVNRLVGSGHENIRAVDLLPTNDWLQVNKSVENISMDLSTLENCQQAVEGVTQVYNLAGEVGNIHHVRTNRVKAMLSVLINTHLLMASHEKHITKYLYASSTCIYPINIQEDINAPALTEDLAYPAFAEDGYGWEKLFSERLCLHYHEEYGLNTKILRYDNSYGPKNTWKGGKEKAPASLCKKVAEAKLKKENEIDIWGDGNQIRGFLYIDDAMEATIMAMESDANVPINIASDRQVTINELISIIEDAANYHVKKNYIIDKTRRGVFCRKTDITRARDLLGWAPKVTLEEGIKKTYAWIEDQVAAELKV